MATTSVLTRKSLPSLARANAAEAGIPVGVRGRLSAEVYAALLSATAPKNVRALAAEVGFTISSKSGKVAARDIHALSVLLHGNTTAGQSRKSE